MTFAAGERFQVGLASETERVRLSPFIPHIIGVIGNGAPERKGPGPGEGAPPTVQGRPWGREGEGFGTVETGASAGWV